MINQIDLNLTVTILIAIIPAIYTWLDKREKRLILVIDKNLFLFKDIAYNISGITISYNGSNIKESLYLMKGFIFYIGDKDLSNNKENRTYISVPKDCNILDFKIVDIPDGLNAKSSIENNKVYIDFDLLKHGEYIYTELLMSTHKEIENEAQLIQDPFTLNNTPYTLNHRIGDIAKADTFTFENYVGLARSCFMIIAALLFFCFVAYLTSTYANSTYNYTPIFFNKDKEIEINKFYTDKFQKKYKDDSLKVLGSEDVYIKFLNNLDLITNKGKAADFKYSPKTTEEKLGRRLVELFYSEEYFPLLQKKRAESYKIQNLTAKYRYLASDSASIQVTNVRSLSDKTLSENVIKDYNVLSFVLTNETKKYIINQDISVVYSFKEGMQSYFFILFILSAFGVYILLVQSLSRLYRYRHILTKILNYREKSSKVAS